MKEKVVNAVCKLTKLSKKEVEGLVENPPTQEMGDYSFPCFSFSKREKKKPSDIAVELAGKSGRRNLRKLKQKDLM